MDAGNLKQEISKLQAGAELISLLTSQSEIKPELQSRILACVHKIISECTGRGTHFDNAQSMAHGVAHAACLTTPWPSPSADLEANKENMTSQSSKVDMSQVYCTIPDLNFLTPR